MKFHNNDKVETPDGPGYVDTPMEDSCLICLSKVFRPLQKHPGDLKLYANEDLKKVE